MAPYHFTVTHTSKIVEYNSDIFMSEAVPEFPVPVIGLVVAIMVGTVVLLGRTKIFPSGI